MVVDEQVPIQTRGRDRIARLIETITVLACGVGIPILVYRLLHWKIMTLSQIPVGVYTESPLKTLHFLRSLQKLRNISNDFMGICVELLSFFGVSVGIGVLRWKGHSRQSLPSRVARIVGFGWVVALFMTLVELFIDA